MDLLTPNQRTDGALIPGDITSGQQNSAVPLRAPIERPSTLGNPSGPGRVVGDMTSGMPRDKDNHLCPDLGPIERLDDTRTQLPKREGGEP
jgi:hypothetical protein